jgi:hypothetical protein
VCRNTSVCTIVKDVKYTHANISNRIAKYVIWRILEDIFEATAIINGKGVVRITVAAE